MARIAQPNQIGYSGDRQDHLKGGDQRRRKTGIRPNPRSSISQEATYFLDFAPLAESRGYFYRHIGPVVQLHFQTVNLPPR